MSISEKANQAKMQAQARQRNMKMTGKGRAWHAYLLQNVDVGADGPMSSFQKSSLLD